MAVPRAEYPRPQFVRKDWVNLNGTWTYEFDFGNTAFERELYNSKGFDNKITVPFCPESSLSGVGHKDVINHMVYHKKLSIPSAWAGKRILLNFGAVDYACEGYVNGKHCCGSHTGGSSSFTFDLTDFVKAGEEADFVLFVHDDVRSRTQMSGKQSDGYHSYGCFYTRVTGIWQTVWMEGVSSGALMRCRIVPDLDGGSFAFTPEFQSVKAGNTLRISVLADGREVGSGTFAAVDGIPRVITLSERRAWSPDDPFLYDVKYEVADKDGNVIDSVTSYAGLRKIHVEGNKVFLNNKELFQRLVLDQGYYEDGIWTAPSDEALKRDIELSLAAGFNGARLHQKVFEERFHYWADKLGYLTWAESPSWGLDFTIRGSIETPQYWQSVANFKKEWSEIVMRDVSHPSIITWTPLNETWFFERHAMESVVRKAIASYRNVMTGIYDLTKMLDPTRPVNDASGYHHVKTDLWTVHYYCPTVEEFKDKMFPKDTPVGHMPPWDMGYNGQPYLCDEFGGFKFVSSPDPGSTGTSWGYTAARTKQEFLDMIRKQVEVLEGDGRVAGFCYTQLTDVEQEQNGVYNYDRSEKLPAEDFRKIFHGNGR